MDDTTKKARREDGLGSRLKDARNKAGFTQKALADAIGLEYYTMISQMELGYMPIPPALWSPLAKNLKDLGGRRFSVECLHEYQPDLYEALFGALGMAEVSEALEGLARNSMPINA